MAKRKRRSGRRYFKGLGSVITTRPRLYGLGAHPRYLRGLGQAGPMVSAVIPIAVGGGTAGIATIATRAFTDPSRGGLQEKLHKYAPWVGLGAGGLAAALMQVLQGRSQAITTFTSAFSVSGLVALLEMMQSRGAVSREASAGNAITQAPVAAAAMQGAFGAVVPEYSRPLAGLASNGVGAIVMEPQASRGYGAGALGSYGEEVNLGNINPSAFGTPGFTV